MTRPSKSPVSIGPIRIDGADAGRGVTAEVDGWRVWFESPDLQLPDSPEAFGSAFLLPALHHRARLQIAGAVDLEWLANTRRIVSLLHDWWRYPTLWPEAAVRDPVETVSNAATAADADGPAALFFSGGVDSFYELLRGRTPVGWIVTLHGFDFPLEDEARAAAVDASVRQVAAALGIHSAQVRTNARLHPLISDTPWERAYGGVLGGVALLLAPVARRVVIASSAPSDREVPWGSHWQLDPLWSSRHVTVMHGGRGVRRIEKLRAIASEPLIRDHLRVCWRNLAPTGNCSRCAKCLLAMLILEERGELAHSRVFEGRADLAARIDALRKTPDRIREFDELSRGGHLSPALVTAATALVRRSRRLQRPDLRWRRAVLKWARTRLRRPDDA